MSIESGSCLRCGETKKHESGPAEICLEGVWVLLAPVTTGAESVMNLALERSSPSSFASSFVGPRTIRT